MPRILRQLGSLVAALLLVSLAGCSAGPSNRPAVAYHDSDQPPRPGPPPEPAPVPPLGVPAAGNLPWQDCTDQTRRELDTQSLPHGMTFSCSSLITNLDSPGATADQSTEISLLGVGSGAIPLVVLGDAGGEPGTTLAARLAAKLPPEMLRTFNIIGIDRRGTGQSEPADCIPPHERETITGFDPRATDRATLDRLLESVRSSSQQCLLKLEDRLPAYDTWRTAADLEELRIELGVPKLHALGRGEGARVLTTYTERFPRSVGRMVFDGAPDPTLDHLARTESKARTAEQAFDVFAAECQLREPCPLGPDPRRTVHDLIERTRKTPLAATGSTVSAGKIARAALLGLSDRSRWSELTAALAEANHGDGLAVAAFTRPLVSGEDMGPARLDAAMITSCNDTTLRVPPQRSTHVAQEWVARFPMFGGVFAQRLVWCGLWPVSQESPLPPKTPGLPPIPVVATAHDPMTPELGSKHMADQLASGVSLSWQGAGHGAVGRSDCITGKVSRFFVAGVVPPEGTACPA